MEWILQAAAATAVQWILETVLSARHVRSSAGLGAHSTAIRVHYLNGCLLAVAVTALVCVQAMLIAFILATESRGVRFSDVWYFAMFGGLTGYLWTVLRRRWRMMFQLHKPLPDTRRASRHAAAVRRVSRL